MTGTFLGAVPADVSFFGSASWADTSLTASVADFSLATSGSIETASVAIAAPLNFVCHSGFIDKAVIDLVSARVEIPSLETARTKVDLTGFSQARLIMRVTKIDNSEGAVGIQYSLDESIWTFLDGTTNSSGITDVGGPSVTFSGSVIGTLTNGLVSIVSESKTDVFIRMVGIDPQEAGPEVGTISLFFKG